MRTLTDQDAPTPITKKRLVVLSAYDNQWRRLLWQAFNSERLQFPNDGRDVFAKHVDETILFSISKVEVVHPNGEPFIGYNHLPTSETYNNFLKNGLSPKDGRISGRTSTLQIIHLFLWLKRPEIVERWNQNRADTTSTDFVVGLDETFKLFDPGLVFQSPIRLFEMPQHQPARNASRLSEFYYGCAGATFKELSGNAQKYLQHVADKKERGFRFLGVIVPGAPVNGLRQDLFFDDVDWLNLEKSTFGKKPSKKEAFNLLNRIVPKGSVLVEDKSIHPSKDFERPRVRDGAAVWVFRAFDDLIGKYRYRKIDSISLKALKLGKLPLTDTSAALWVHCEEYGFDLTDQLMYAGRFLPECEDGPILTAGPLLESDVELINLLTGRSE